MDGAHLNLSVRVDSLVYVSLVCFALQLCLLDLAMPCLHFGLRPLRHLRRWNLVWPISASWPHQEAQEGQEELKTERWIDVTYRLVIHSLQLIVCDGSLGCEAEKRSSIITDT